MSLASLIRQHPDKPSPRYAWGWDIRRDVWWMRPASDKDELIVDAVMAARMIADWRGLGSTVCDARGATDGDAR